MNIISIPNDVKPGILKDLEVANTISSSSGSLAGSSINDGKTAESAVYTAGPTKDPNAEQAQTVIGSAGGSLSTQTDRNNEEYDIQNAYIEAEKNTGDNRTSGSVAGSAVSNRGVNNNKKAGKFLENSNTSIKSEPNVPGYSLL